MTEESGEALTAAMQAYHDHFQDMPPMTLFVGADKTPALILAMAAAVKRNRRLSEKEVAAISGHKPVDTRGAPPGTPPLVH